MAESMQGLDPPDWDPLWFLQGHPMRKELDRVMEEFVLDSINPDDQLGELPYRNFQSMIERFCNENGDKFWGRNNRAHLGLGAPVWRDKQRSIKMALRWEFRIVEERLHQKLIAEARQRRRADDHKGYQQAITGAENNRPRPSSTDDAVDLARLNGGMDSIELMHPERRERILLGALENVQNPTITPTTTLALRQRSPIVKKERNMSFGNNGDRDDGHALLLAKFREITQDGRRIPKRDAQSALEEDEANDAQGRVVFKIPKHPRIQFTHAQNALQGKEGNNEQGQVVVKIPKGPRIPFTPQQERDLIRCGVLKTYAPQQPSIQFTQQEQQEPIGGVLKTYAPRQTHPSVHQQRNTTLHFFLSDPNLGAIPISLQNCMERGDFLAEVLTAWRGLEPGSSTPTLVSVRFHWAPVPMVLKWRDKTGFNMMLEAIAAAPCWQQLDHRCNVEVHGVKCRT